MENYFDVNVADLFLGFLLLGILILLVIILISMSGKVRKIIPFSFSYKEKSYKTEKGKLFLSYNCGRERENVMQFIGFADERYFKIFHSASSGISFEEISKKSLIEMLKKSQTAFPKEVLSSLKYLGVV